MLEYYKYDLNGKPTYWSASDAQLSGSAYAIVDLFAGERYIPELGLYDDRNRFMSPDLGRFLQPDPIGFKGDASNLYRYCGNDWANKTDPMGLDVIPSDPGFTIKLRNSQADAMGIDKYKQMQLTIAQVSQARNVEPGNSPQKASGTDKLVPIAQDENRESKTPRQLSVEAAKQAQKDSKHGEIYGYNAYRLDGKIIYQRTDPAVAGSQQDTESIRLPPQGAVFVANGHVHRENEDNRYRGSSHSPKTRIYRGD